MTTATNQFHNNPPPSTQVVELVRAPYVISLDAGTVPDQIPGSTAWGTQQIIWQLERCRPFFCLGLICGRDKRDLPA